MKKIVTLLALLTLTAGISFAADNSTYTGSMVNKYTSNIVNKEAQIRKNIADKQAESKKQAEARKQAQEAKKAEINKKIQSYKDSQTAKQNEVKDKIKTKKEAWNTLMSK